MVGAGRRLQHASPDVDGHGDGRVADGVEAHLPAPLVSGAGDLQQAYLVDQGTAAMIAGCPL